MESDMCVSECFMAFDLVIKVLGNNLPKLSVIFL